MIYGAGIRSTACIAWSAMWFAMNQSCSTQGIGFSDHDPSRVSYKRPCPNLAASRVSECL